jgi:hypothetical protein
MRESEQRHVTLRINASGKKTSQPLTSICTVIFVETIAFSLLLFFNQPIVEITFLGLPLSLFFTLGYYLLLVLLAM